jgi:hypothetical protein
MRKDLVGRYVLYSSDPNFFSFTFKIQDILGSLLESTLSACANSIRSSLSRRTFGNCFPRFASLSLPESGWEEGENVIVDAIVCEHTMKEKKLYLNHLGYCGCTRYFIKYSPLQAVSRLGYSSSPFL